MIKVMLVFYAENAEGIIWAALWAFAVLARIIFI